MNSKRIPPPPASYVRQREHLRAAFACCAVICAAFLRFALPPAAQEAYSIGFLPLFAAIAYFALFKTVAARFPRPRREIAFTTLLALFFSACFVLGSSTIEEGGNGDYANPLTYLSIVINALPLFCLIELLWERLNERWATRTASSSPVVGSWKLGLAFFFGLLACWTPVLLASWPGFFSYDVGSLYLGEWAQYSSGELNSHHSVLHTLLLGSIVSLGNELHSFNAGVALFNILQALAISGVFTYALLWMRRHGAGRLFLGLSFAFLALNPLVSMFVLCSNSDTLFAAVALLLVLQVHDLIAGECRRQATAMAVLTATAFLFCALRPNAPFALALFLPFAFFLTNRTRRLAALAPLATAFALFLIWNFPVAGLMNVQSSYLQNANAFTVPSQQLAYTYLQGELGIEEQEYLADHHYTFPEEYVPELGDYARYSIYNMSVSERITSWAHIGLQHPAAFTDAFLLHTQDAWNPYSYSNSTVVELDDGSMTSLFACNVQEPAVLNTKLPPLYDALNAFSHQLAAQRVPFVALLVFLPLYTALTLVGLARSLIVRDHPSTGVYLLFAILICSVLLGPGVIVRYYLYLVFGFPLLVFLLRRPDNHAVQAEHSSLYNTGT